MNNINFPVHAMVKTVNGSRCVAIVDHHGFLVRVVGNGQDGSWIREEAQFIADKMNEFHSKKVRGAR